MTSIWWIRRDLRLTDNPALHSALGQGQVIPVFILDPAFSTHSPRRRNFLYEGLNSLHKNLQSRGSYLVVRAGKPADVLRRLMQETNASAIFAEEDYTPYARKRDADISRDLPLQLVLGQTVHHPEFGSPCCRKFSSPRLRRKYPLLRVLRVSLCPSLQTILSFRLANAKQSSA